MKKVFLVSFSVVSVIVMAQNRNLTLQEAIDLSLQSNKKIKLLETQSKQAALKVEEAKNMRLPDVNITTAAQYLPPTSDVTLDLGLPTSATSAGSDVSPDYMLTFQAGASVPLFSGFKIKNGIAVAEYAQKAQDLNIDNQKQDASIQAIELFSNLYKTQKAIAVVEENLKRSQNRVKDFTNFMNNGTVARNDLMRVQLQESNVELALAETKKNERILNYNLGLLLGLENEKLTPVMSNDRIEEAISEEDYLNKAHSGRKEFEMLDYQKKIAEKSVEIAKGNYYPSVALTAGYNYYKVGDNITLAHSTSVGLGIKYNLSSLYKNKVAIAEAEAKALEVQNNVDLLNDAVKTQIHSAYEEYQYAQEKMNVYQKALSQAQENYRIVKTKYDNGLATTDELLTADVEELQAQLNKTYGESDIQLNYYKLLRQIGGIK